MESKRREYWCRIKLMSHFTCILCSLHRCGWHWCSQSHPLLWDTPSTPGLSHLGETRTHQPVCIQCKNTVEPQLGSMLYSTREAPGRSTLSCYKFGHHWDYLHCHYSVTTVRDSQGSTLTYLFLLLLASLFAVANLWGSFLLITKRCGWDKRDEDSCHSM